jgi:predicted metal-dependent enzyme (double-stranded beta helix superfamily)
VAARRGVPARRLTYARSIFDVDDLVVACIAAAADPEPRLAIRDVIERAVADPAAIASALPPTRAEMVALHVSSDLTVLKLVWAPGMVLGPHDHRMWAAIGLYSGGEDNRFFRRRGDELADSGARSLQPKDVCLLGDDVIHSVHNPTAEHAGAIHVYGGDFFTQPRSEWTGEPPREGPYDVERVRALFDAANTELA